MRKICPLFVSGFLFFVISTVVLADSCIGNPTSQCSDWNEDETTCNLYGCQFSASTPRQEFECTTHYGTIEQCAAYAIACYANTDNWDWCIGGEGCNEWEDEQSCIENGCTPTYECDTYCTSNENEEDCNNQYGCLWNSQWSYCIAYSGGDPSSCTGDLTCENCGTQSLCQAIGCTWQTSQATSTNESLISLLLRKMGFGTTTCTLLSASSSQCMASSTVFTSNDGNIVFGLAVLIFLNSMIFLGFLFKNKGYD